MKEIDLSNEGGSLTGYIVDAREPNLENYLAQHTSISKAIMHHLRQRGERIALLRNLHIDEDLRGNGFGSDLVGQFFVEAAEGGATAYLLICDEAEGQAEGFDLCEWYKSFGFASVFKTSQGPFMVIPPTLCESLSEFLGVDEEPEDDFEP